MSQPASEHEVRRIYRDTIDDLYEFVSRHCDGDRDLAEDITQETWLRAVRSWQSGVPDEPIAWLTTVARNLLASHYRRRPTESLDDRTGELVAADPSDNNEDRLSLLSRALARLSLPQLQVVQAFHFERRRVADIAAAQSISERAVEGRLRRGTRYRHLHGTRLGSGARCCPSRFASRVGACGCCLDHAEAQAGQQARAARANLNIQEIQSTSQPPRDELTAPLVGAKDFVSERIQLDLFGAQQRLSAAEQALAEVQRGVRLGTATEVAMLEAQVTASRARADMAVLAQRRSLRREFVQKGTSAAELARRMELAQVRQDIVITQKSSELAKARLQLLEKQPATGAAQQLEVMRAQVAVKEAQIQLYQLVTRMRQISEPLPDSGAAANATATPPQFP